MDQQLITLVASGGIVSLAYQFFKELLPAWWPDRYAAALAGALVGYLQVALGYSNLSPITAIILGAISVPAAHNLLLSGDMGDKIKGVLVAK